MAKYYSSIKDIPVYNWFQIFEEKQYQYALINRKAKIDKYIHLALQNLQDNYTKIFGLDPKYEAYLRAKMALELLEIKRTLTGDKSLGTLIQVAQLNLQAMTDTGIKVSSNDAVVAVEKYMGFRIDTRVVTVYEFYGYVKSIAKNVKPSGKN